MTSLGTVFSWFIELRIHLTSELVVFSPPQTWKTSCHLVKCNFQLCQCFFSFDSGNVIVTPLLDIHSLFLQSLFSSLLIRLINSLLDLPIHCVIHPCLLSCWGVLSLPSNLSAPKFPFCSSLYPLFCLGFPVFHLGIIAFSSSLITAVLNLCQINLTSLSSRY